MLNTDLLNQLAIKEPLKWGRHLSNSGFQIRKASSPGGQKHCDRCPELFASYFLKQRNRVSVWCFDCLNKFWKKGVTFFFKLDSNHKVVSLPQPPTDLPARYQQKWWIYQFKFADLNKIK